MRKHLWVVLLSVVLPVAAGAAIIDDFEDGNMTEWVQTTPSTPLGTSITAAAAHDGALGLQAYSVRQGFIYRNDAQAQVAQGDHVSCWTQLNNSSWTRNYFGFGATASGCYSAVLGDNTNTFILQLNSGYGYATLAETPYVFINRYWYWVDIDWQVGGTIIANLYDSNGTTLLATVQAVSNTYTSGGVALRTFGDANDAGYWDTFEKDGGPTPVETASWGSVKQLFR